MLIVDSHEDLAYNIRCFGRDYTRSVAETRAQERDTDIPAHNGSALLGWPDYQQGQVAVVFGTLFATPKRMQVGAWDTQVYADFEQAHAVYSNQMDAYHRLVDEHPDRFHLIRSRAGLNAVIEGWKTNPLAKNPVGIVTLMEGAEGVRHPGELDEWWARGVRLIGPAWAGTRYCGGTREPGPLTSDGYALLEAMAALGFGLDLSHMDARAALQALDIYPGTVVASHSNAAALLKGLDSNRHLPDDVLRGLIERGGVIGVLPYNKFLLPGWQQSERRDRVSLQHVVAQIDYICQMAGDARHVGIGTDFEGGFGVECVPVEIDTIADLQKLAPLLAERGYCDSDIAAIFGENWLAKLAQILPEVS
ncbi:MAG: dipeptidase [Chloroflexota bacterium]